MEEEDYGHEGGKFLATRSHYALGSDMDGQMVYQDEDGNLIMYNHDEMGEDDDGGEEGGEHMDHDDYGMEGSPGVSRLTIYNCCFY